MDIISLSKASRVIQNKDEYQKGEVGYGVEAHFASLDERLDFLEGVGSIPNITEVIQMLQEDAVMINTFFEANILKLKYTDLDHVSYKRDYVPEGTYEKIFDLTGSYIQTQLIAIAKSAATNQEAKIEYAHSDDGITYSSFTELKTSTKFKRFVHIRISLKANNVLSITYDYNVTLEPASRVTNNLLLLNKTYSAEQDTSHTGMGTLLVSPIDEDLLRVDDVTIMNRASDDRYAVLHDGVLKTYGSSWTTLSSLASGTLSQPTVLKRVTGKVKEETLTLNPSYALPEAKVFTGKISLKKLVDITSIEVK